MNKLTNSELLAKHPERHRANIVVFWLFLPSVVCCILGLAFYEQIQEQINSLEIKHPYLWIIGVWFTIVIVTKLKNRASTTKSKNGEDE